MIIQECKDDVFYVMECIIQGTLECGTRILKTRRHDVKGNGTPRCGESNLVLILWEYLDLIVTRKAIHEVVYFMTDTCIKHLVDKQYY